MASYHAPHDWKDWSDWIAAGLHSRALWRLAPLLLGLLFGQGRRVVAAWIRAAGLSDDYQDYYYFLQSIGLRWRELGRRVLVLVLDHILKDTPRVLLAIDDSPTRPSSSRRPTWCCWRRKRCNFWGENSCGW